MFDGELSQPFRLIIDALPIGIVGVDASGRITLVNAQTERLFGYAADEMLGQRIEVLVPDRFRDHHPLERASYTAAPAARLMGVGRELYARRKNGTEFPVEIGLNPVDALEGKVVLATVIDITERKSREELHLQNVVEQQQRQHHAEYLAAVGKALAISLDPAIVRSHIRELFVPAVADWTVVHVFAPTEYSGDPHRELPALDVLERRLAAVARALFPTVVDASRAAIREHFDPPIEGTLAEAVMVPMITDDGVIGTISFGRSATRGSANAADCELYEELTSLAARAIANAGSFRNEHDIADILQRSFLATPIPTDRRLLVDSVYLPSKTMAQVGGDWYDCFALDNDRFAVSIGDVAGHGIHAAVTMNLVRLTFRAAALGGIDPVSVLERGDRVLQLEGDPPMVTAIYGIVDLRRKVFSYASAGHWPPLIAREDGTIEAPFAHGIPLGIGFTDERTLAEVSLLPGDTLVLYTDGLVEYDRDALLGEQRLRELLRGLMIEEPRASVARDLQTRVFEGKAQQDDVAVLAVSILPAARTVQWEMPAIPSSVPQLRRKLRGFWAETPCSGVEPFDFLTAVGEAIANAVEHAYPDAAGVVSVRASYDDRGVSVEVADLGRYKSGGSSPNRGFGITIMEALAQEVSIDGGEGGTVVRLAWGISPKNEGVRAAVALSLA